MSSRNRSCCGLVSAALFCALAPSFPVAAEALPEAASEYGKYFSPSGRPRQILACPEEQANPLIGRHYDYGRWEGGPWCGEAGQAGYWVYHYPNWYVWPRQRGVPADDPAPQTCDPSFGGRYSGLVGKIHCPRNRKTFSPQPYAWGRRWDGVWCGRRAAGYWVYCYPHWHVWERRD